MRQSRDELSPQAVNQQQNGAAVPSGNLSSAASSTESLVDHSDAKFTYRMWTDVAQKPLYQEIRTGIYERFRTEKSFKNLVQRSARSYIETKAPDKVRKSWAKIRGEGGQAFQRRKAVAELAIGLGQHYLLETSALLLYLNETEFDTCFYKNPLGSALTGMLSNSNAALQIRERDFNTLGELTNSFQQPSSQTLAPLHYLILSTCIEILSEMSNRAAPQAEERHIDSAYDLDFDGRSVVIPISVRSLSFQAKSYNSPEGIEALARHITEDVDRVCFLIVDQPHSSSDLQDELIEDLANYYSLPDEAQDAATLTVILSNYFELDSRGKPQFFCGLPAINTTGDKYSRIVEANRGFGAEWKATYLPGLAATFEQAHFKSYAREAIFEPDFAEELLTIMPPPSAIPDFTSYYKHMLSVLSIDTIKKEALGFVHQVLVTKSSNPCSDLARARSSSDSKSLHVFAYLVVACDFIIQAGLSRRVGKLALDDDKYTKAHMVGVLTRTFNEYRRRLMQVRATTEQGSGAAAAVVSVPYLTPITHIANLITEGERPDVDRYVIRVCESARESSAIVESPSLASQDSNTADGKHTWDVETELKCPN